MLILSFEGFSESIPLAENGRQPSDDDERVKRLNLCALLQGMNTSYCKIHIYVCTVFSKVRIEGGPQV